MEEIKCKVSGRVQMVMFRDFVQRKARGLRLKGWVQNMNDGTVELVAQGGREQLKELLAHIRKGPLLARVDHVDVEHRKPAEQFDGFAIHY